MLKTKKNYVILAIITAFAMLFAGITTLFGAIRTNVASEVYADDVSSIAGTTWQIKNKPSEYLLRLKVDFTSNGETYHMLNMGPWGEPNGYYYMIYVSSGNYDSDMDYVYDQVGSYYKNSSDDATWEDEAYRTITFAQNAIATIWSYDDEEFVDGSEALSEWLYVNARRVDGLEEPPQTGVVLDIILPNVVIAVVLVATIYVAKKKEYNC